MTEPNWALSRVLPDALATEHFGAALANELRAGDLLVLTGPLGAGKTTLTRGIGAGFGVRGPITSPTFVLARTHPSLGAGSPLVHVDAYRLSDARELDDLDLDFAGSLVVVEWGAGLLDGVAESWLELTLARDPAASHAASATASGQQDPGTPGLEPVEPEWDAEPRQLLIRGFGPRWAQPPAALD